MHIIPALMGYLLWMVAAMSAALYLILDRERASESSEGSGPDPSSLDYWAHIRYSLTFYYLVFGVLIFSAALVEGYLKARVHWGRLPWLDGKVVLSIMTWLYYTCVLMAIPILKYKKYEKKEWLVSVLSLVGVAVVALTVLGSFFSGHHHYL